MCGIVGYTGNKQAAPILLSGLAKLEYRGYDSAGVVVRSGENAPEVVKAKGRLRVLEEKTNNGQALMGTCGVGHTRWATHGEPSESQRPSALQRRYERGGRAQRHHRELSGTEGQDDPQGLSASIRRRTPRC